ncbi:MAG: hypothetical protein R3E79_51355 [Caldilineaceae bacterium]
MPEQDAVTLTYGWDFNGDGSYDDATGRNPTFSAAGLDGPRRRDGLACWSPMRAG